MTIDLAELKSLPVGEKLRLVEWLWNEIGESNEPIALTPDQLATAKSRSEEMKANPSIAIDRDEMWQRVNNG